MRLDKQKMKTATVIMTKVKMINTLQLTNIKKIK